MKALRTWELETTMETEEGIAPSLQLHSPAKMGKIDHIVSNSILDLKWICLKNKMTLSVDARYICCRTFSLFAAVCSSMLFLMLFPMF